MWLYLWSTSLVWGGGGWIGNPTLLGCVVWAYWWWAYKFFPSCWCSLILIGYKDTGGCCYYSSDILWKSFIMGSCMFVANNCWEIAYIPSGDCYMVCNRCSSPNRAIEIYGLS